MLLKNFALISLIFLLIACENVLKGNSSDPAANAGGGTTGGGTTGGVSGCTINGHCTFQEMWSSNVRTDCMNDGSSVFRIRMALLPTNGQMIIHLRPPVATFFMRTARVAGAWMKRGQW